MLDKGRKPLKRTRPLTPESSRVTFHGEGVLAEKEGNSFLLERSGRFGLSLVRSSPRLGNLFGNGRFVKFRSGVTTR